MRSGFDQRLKLALLVLSLLASALWFVRNSTAGGSLLWPSLYGVVLLVLGALNVVQGIRQKRGDGVVELGLGQLKPSSEG